MTVSVQLGGIKMTKMFNSGDQKFNKSAIVSMIQDEFSTEINKALRDAVLDTSAVQKKLDNGTIDKGIQQAAEIMAKSLDTISQYDNVNEDYRYFFALTETFGSNITPPYRGE